MTAPSPPEGRLFFHMTAAFDEFQRELTVENTRGGRENCDFYTANDPERPVNWCRWRRSIKPAHGWTGHLTSDALKLRVQVRDHILNMPGPVFLQHTQSCP